MIRLILVAFFLLDYFLVSLPIFLVLWIVRKIHKPAADKFTKGFVWFGFRVILFLSGTKVHASGMEQIPKEGPVLFVANHCGFFDILLTYTKIPNVFGFVAKKEIRKVPLLNIWMYFVNCLWIDRENMKESMKTILQGIEMLKAGTSVFIFPEGTRSKDGQIHEFKEGALKMAVKAKCPIVPIAIKGTDDVLENHFPKIKGCHTYMKVGAPIYVDQLEKEQQKFIGAYTQHIVEEMYAHIEE